MRRFFAMLLMLVVSSGLCAAPQKEWTILVYAVTDSFLADTVMNDIDEMEMLGSSDQVEILVQLDKNDYNPVRYRVKHDEKPGFIASSIVGSPQNTDCGSWETLYEFACWGKSTLRQNATCLFCMAALAVSATALPLKIFWSTANSLPTTMIRNLNLIRIKLYMNSKKKTAPAIWA